MSTDSQSTEQAVQQAMAQVTIQGVSLRQLLAWLAVADTAEWAWRLVGMASRAPVVSSDRTSSPRR